MNEYCSIFYSQRWEPTDSKKKYQDKTLLQKASTMETEDTFNKTVEKVYFKIRHNGKYNNSGLGSSTKSVATCHKCVKKSHMKSNCKYNRYGSDG